MQGRTAHHRHYSQLARDRLLLSGSLSNSANMVDQAGVPKTLSPKPFHIDTTTRIHRRLQVSARSRIIRYGRFGPSAAETSLYAPTWCSICGCFGHRRFLNTLPDKGAGPPPASPGGDIRSDRVGARGRLRALKPASSFEVK
jgi:hypothetical protein